MPAGPITIVDALGERVAGVGKVFNQGLSGIRREGGVLVTPHHTDVASYVGLFNVAATAAMDIFSIGGQANKVTRLRRIVLVNPGSATGAIVVDLTLGTASFNGAGGALATVNAVDAFTRPGGMLGGPDAALAAALFRTGDTTLATGFSGTYNPLASVSVPAAAAGFNPLVIYDARDPLFKALAEVGGAAGITLRTPIVGVGAAGLRGYVEFTVEDA